MTRKHFILLAEIISKIENDRDRAMMFEKTAEMCAKANPNFNLAKFRQACNVP